ncbi:MAG: bifunctional phosphopantothenoylcysteine decarboxylase/phosphopantothenate--cysteine ligase CoaBC [Campylobacterales bacterium]|nr:bifunctional phosphopantothenoylcysteine decarboxylase/phosphopantothenate--cysteine ligase CoaBC [Campylobacterales bacterium]
MLLKNKKILLGVTGSIAAYKACEVARLFIKAGANVQVVMSEAATRFVSPLTFEALTRNPVLCEDSESWANNLNHIEISKDCDMFLIAPATANTINKLSKGIADNILLQSALAFNKPIAIAPSANTNMLGNHHTKNSLKMLAVSDITIIEPQEKLLACGDTGNGALADPQEIFWQCAKVLLKDPFWSDRRVVVTGGGTIEKIDDIRYISNFSSGKMANAIASALYTKGADVCLIRTKETKDLPNDIYTIDVESAQDMLGFTEDALRVARKGVMSKPSLNNPDALGMIQKEPFLFMVAAVADYTPSYPQAGKIKKNTIGESWNIELKQNSDILKTINKDGIKTVAFKAETDSDNGLANAASLLSDKGADAVCYNLISDANNFGGDYNEIIWITPTEQVKIDKQYKLSLAFKILENAKRLSV